jgi:transcriptional regulator
MYIPKANLTTDQDEIVAFMKEYSFATLITSRDNIPVASHLPFTISQRDSQLILSQKVILPVLRDVRNYILNLV